MDQERSGRYDLADELARRRRARQMHPAARAERRRGSGEALPAELCEREREHAAFALREVDRVCCELERLLLAHDPDAAARLTTAVARAAAAQDRYEAALARWGTLQAPRPDERDRLTGVLQRAPGVERLLHQLQRCGRERPLVLAFVQLLAVGGDGPVTDDARRRLGVCLRTALRDYDVSVRLGPDEFLCGLHGADRETVQERFATLALALRLPPPCTLQVVLLEVEDGESLLDALDGAGRAAVAPGRVGTS